MRYCLDGDLKNAFHQLLLHKNTRRNLAVLTPWGLFEPLFLPEGLSCASGLLNDAMNKVFHNHLHNTLVIFDNFLTMAVTLDEMADETIKIITTCATRDVILGMKKTKIGFPEAIFFGYKVADGKYSLTDDRKQSVTSIKMPGNLKQMQRFLGASIYFSKNMPRYSFLAAPLNQMTKKDFDWTVSTWTRDYVEDFNIFREAILASVAISFPDYNNTFILRTDASDVAWGGVLLQVLPGGTYECIGLCSAKWSGPAQIWKTAKQEAAAIYLAFKKFSPQIVGKMVIIETDHKNILFWDGDETPIIQRWRLYVQSFLSCVRHNLGKYNTADWLTRQYNLYNIYFGSVPSKTDTESGPVPTPYKPYPHNDFPSKTDTESGPDSTLHTLMNVYAENDHSTDSFFSSMLEILLCSNDSDSEDDTDQVSNLYNENRITLDDMFKAVHGGNLFHRGVSATYRALNEKFPGHIIPIRVIAEKIAECPTCQKTRLRYAYTLPSENLNLKVQHCRRRVGVDTLTITPVDKFGNGLAIIVVDHFSKFASIYPCKDHSADSTARALMVHYSTYGRYEQIISDPGSDLMSATIVALNEFLGQEKLVSIVERHESNGVEPTCKKYLAFLRQLVQDRRVAYRWSDPVILLLIQNALNSQIHSETNFSPMEMHFGSQVLPYMSLPEKEINSTVSSEILLQFNNDIKLIRQLSYEYQQSLVLKRDNSEYTQNKYKEGEYVLFLYSFEGKQLNKADSKYLGPFRVLTHVKNDVTVRNLITDVIKVYHSSRLKPFYGSKEQAYDTALRDADQYVIEEIIAYRGDPQIRGSISFLILFRDGTKEWKAWSNDLFDAVPYENFCRLKPQLFPLIYRIKEAKILIKEINLQPIISVNPGDEIFLDIRAFGAGWYESLNLPNFDFAMYVVVLKYTQWQNKSQTKIESVIPSLKKSWVGRYAMDSFFVKCWGNNKILTPNMTLINSEFVKEHKILERL
jgi:hypothetical protein